MRKSIKATQNTYHVAGFTLVFHNAPLGPGRAESIAAAFEREARACTSRSTLCRAIWAMEARVEAMLADFGSTDNCGGLSIGVTFGNGADLEWAIRSDSLFLRDSAIELEPTATFALSVSEDEGIDYSEGCQLCG